MISQNILSNHQIIIINQIITIIIKKNGTNGIKYHNKKEKKEKLKPLPVHHQRRGTASLYLQQYKSKKVKWRTTKYLQTKWNVNDIVLYNSDPDDDESVSEHVHQAKVISIDETSQIIQLKHCKTNEIVNFLFQSVGYSSETDISHDDTIDDQNSNSKW